MLPSFVMRRGGWVALGLVCGAAGCTIVDFNGLTGGLPVSSDGGVPLDGDARVGDATAPGDVCTPSIQLARSSIPTATNLSVLGVVYWTSGLLEPKSEKADAPSPFFDFTLFNENSGSFGNLRTGQPVGQTYSWTDGNPVSTYGPATPTTSGWWEVGEGTGYRVSMRDVGAARRVIADVDALNGRFEASFADGSHKQTVSDARNVRVTVTVIGCDPAAILTMAIRSNVSVSSGDGDPYIVFYMLAIAQ